MRACTLVLGLALTVASPQLWAANVRLTIVSAKIDPAKVKGAQHMSTASLSDLACLSLPGLRDLAGRCGGAGVGGEQPNIDPFVRVEIGDRVIRTYPVPGSYTPKWEYGVILDKAFLDKDDSADFILYDYDGPGAEQKIGDKLVKARDLLKPGTKTLTGLGGAQLTYRVEVLPDSTPPRNYSFRVPADQQMADLARNAKTSGPGYVVIPVAEGEEVEVQATGKVLPSAKKHPDRVAGPNGIPTIKTKIQFNQPGFRGCPGCDHAALIGQIGTTGMVLGEHKKFTVDNSGLLVLAINDLKVSDNEGGYDVKVSVTLPASTAGSARAPGKTKGSAADSGPSGLDPRVVQQIVDQHGPELDACAAAEPNPYGELVLVFSISADGSLLGVIVEKASPNLKKAGDCMRQKALKWRFPPPHGVVTARYPISYSAG
jgi:hypothetical protein